MTTVISITLVLFMLGLLGLIILHARKISDYVRENIGFHIIMKENTNEAGIIRFQKQLDISKYVKSTEYITTEEAASQLKAELGEDFIDFIGYNPLLPSIDVRLKAQYANLDSLEVIKRKLLANNEVKEVDYQKSLVHVVNENIRRLSIIILGFSVLLLIIAMALINNTIRLAVYSKRFIIKTMQLVGATERFIRRPFVWRGILHGIIGAFFAIILLVGTLSLARNEIPELIELQDVDLFLTLFGFVILLGIFISWVSTYLAVRKFLRIKTDYLY